MKLTSPQGEEIMVLKNRKDQDHRPKKTTMDDIASSSTSVLQKINAPGFPKETETASAVQAANNRADFLHRLVRVGQRLSRARDLASLAQIAWNFASSQLKVSDFAFAVYDARRQILRFPLVIENRHVISLEDRYLRKGTQEWGLCGYIVQTGKELLWSSFIEGQNWCQSLDIRPIQVGRVNQSCLYLPLKSGRKILGVLSIQSHQPNIFTLELLERIRAFGGQLAVALENQRLLQAEKDHRQEADILRNAALALSSDLDSKKIFRRLLIELKQVVPYDTATVQLLEKDFFVIIEGEGFPNSADIIRYKFSIHEHNPNRLVYKRRKMVILTDAPALFPQFAQPPHNQAGIHAWMAVPLIIDNELIGLLDLGKREPGYYRQGEYDHILQAFSAQAALLLKKFMLFNDLQKSQNYIESMYEASAQVTSAFETDHALHYIVDTICKQTNAWRAVALRLEPGSPPIVLAQSGFEMSSEEATHIRPDGITWQVINSCSPRFLSNLDLDSEHANQDMRAQGIHAAACLPLVTGERAFGVVWIHFREPRTFNEVEIQVLTLFVRQSASVYYQKDLVCHQAQLVDELTHLRDETQNIARIAVQEPLLPILNTIAQAAQKILHAQIVTLYPYHYETDAFVFPPAMVGVRYEPPVLALGRVSENSLVREILTRNDPFECEDVHTNPILKKRYERLKIDHSFIQREHVESLYAAPLIAGNKKVGVLFISYLRPHRFTQAERDNAALFANQAALAIHNALYYIKLAHDEKEQVDVLEAILTASHEVTSSLSLESILHTMAQVAYRLTGRTGEKAASIQLYRDCRHHLACVEMYPPASEPLDSQSPPQIVEQAAAERRPVLSNPERKPSVQSELAVPIISQDRVLGVIYAMHPTANTLDQMDITLLNGLANQAAVAIRDAELYESERRGNIYLQSLYEVSQAILSSSEPQAVLQAIVDSVVKATQAWRAVVLVIDPYRREWRGLAHCGFERAEEAQIKIRPGGISNTVVQQQAPIFLSDLTLGDSDVHPDTIKQGARAVACLPLSTGSDPIIPIGVLWIHFCKPHEFTQIEQHALMLFASQSSIAYDRSIRSKELIEARQMAAQSSAIAWIEMIDTTWRHNVEMNAITIRDQVQLLRLYLSRANPDQKKINRLISSLSELAEKIQEKPVNAPLRSEDDLQLIVVSDLVQERLKQLWSNETYRPVQLDLALKIGPDVTVRSSPQWLRRALDILVDNAVKAVRNQPDGLVRVLAYRRVEAQADFVDIAVQDNGPGISPEIRKDLFQKPISEQIIHKGFGTGLMIAQVIVQSYGGKISLDEQFSPGSSFVISLPLDKGDMHNDLIQYP
jgi:GAF domain-containing protein